MLRETLVNRGLFFLFKKIDLLFFLFKKKKYLKKEDRYQKILIIELWGIGDIVLMSSILPALKDRFPQAEVCLLSKNIAKQIIKDRFIDKFFLFDFPWTGFKNKYKLWRWDWKGLFKLIKKLRKEKFDLILDARGDIRNNFLSFLIGGKRRLGYNWSGGGIFLTDVIKIDYKNIHRVEAWNVILRHLNVNTNTPKPYVEVGIEEEKWAEDFLWKNEYRNNKIVVGIHPGARIETRRWPLEKFAKISDYIYERYNSPPLIFVDSEDYGKKIPVKYPCIKVKLSLRELIAVLKKIDILICNDGGVMHIATALNTPVIAIFGPTNPVWFGPWGKGHTLIIKKNVKCRPCFDYCKYEKPHCIWDISIEEVKQAVEEKLRKISNNKKYEFN